MKADIGAVLVQRNGAEPKNEKKKKKKKIARVPSCPEAKTVL